jgi:hypothetical protein
MYIGVIAGIAAIVIGILGLVHITGLVVASISLLVVGLILVVVDRGWIPARR